MPIDPFSNDFDRAYAMCSGAIMSKIVLLHWPKVGQSY